MPEYLDPAELIFILLLAILLFGDRLSGKSDIVRDLTVLAIVCLVLVLELSWLATPA